MERRIVVSLDPAEVQLAKTVLIARMILLAVLYIWSWNIAILQNKRKVL